MRLFSLFLVSVYLLPAWVAGQVHIQGRVLDNANGQPLTGASVYINHSTIGTITQPDGSFALSGLEAGSYELVVSFVGYERIIYDVTVQSRDLRFVFRMEPKVAQLRDILVVSPSMRKQWLEIFRRQFLGTTAAAESSVILNEEDVFFARSGDDKVISAFADVPLVIENKALGYRIIFELLTFNYNMVTDKCSFFGYNHYEELMEEGVKSSRYDIPRQDTYRGSTMHFFHALKNNRLGQEGFSIRTILPATDGRKAKKNTPAENTADTDGAFVAGKAFPASRKTILFLDTAQQQHFLTWKGALEVTYNPPSDPAMYGLVQSGDPEIGSTRGSVSYIFIDADPVYIFDDGMPEDPRSIRFGGIWSSERVANMLPMNYRPNNKSLFDKKRL
jgi:hypothetical protein